MGPTRAIYLLYKMRVLAFRPRGSAAEELPVVFGPGVDYRKATATLDIFC